MVLEPTSLKGGESVANRVISFLLAILVTLSLAFFVEPLSRDESVPATGNPSIDVDEGFNSSGSLSTPASTQPSDEDSFAVDAGGPYVATEGAPVPLQAKVSGGGDDSAVRWDFEGDGIWDTDFDSNLTAEHVYPDDFVGSVQVEARGRGTESEAPANRAAFGVWIALNGDDTPQVAQKFVAESDNVSYVFLDVSINNDPHMPEDLLYVSIRADLDGSDLGVASLSPSGLPGHLVVNWVKLQFPSDISVLKGNVYFLVMTSPGARIGLYEIHGSTLDSYTGGEMYWNVSGLFWEHDDIYDLRFAIGGSSVQYAEDSASLVVQNVAPSIDMDQPPAFFEGSPGSISATATDPGSDDLAFTWKWGDGTPDNHTIYHNDGAGPDPYPSLSGIYPFSAMDTVQHTYGDNGVFAVSLTVEDDDGGVATYTVNVTVLNVLPSGTLSIVTADQYEGNSIAFSAHVTDPGSDDIFLTWHWGFGAPDETSTYFNNGSGPDPFPSPDIHPRDVTDVKGHEYGDNGAFTVSVFVRDDDSASDGITLQVTATPDNLPPSVSVTGGTSIHEGQSAILTAIATDPGSDDLTFYWSWGEGATESSIYYNNGVSPDPPQSPDGKWPFTATDTANHPYGDDGLYPIILSVIDDDGGSASWSGQVVVRNLPPSVAPFGPFTVNEGDPLSITATATDPGSDDLAFTWRWDYGPTDTATFYNDGTGPDPPQSPGGTFPFTAIDSSSNTYGDDCPCNVTLTVTDDDGGTSAYTTTVNVLNLPPSLAGRVEAYARGSLVLRVAGEKWHDVAATVYRNGIEEFTGRVVRTPGSPDDQAVVLGDLTMDLLGSDVWSAWVVYTPEDDPINGQENGANPAWIILRSEHGNESMLHHTFNVQHNDTWTWDIPDMRVLLIGIPIDFTATATDPGSDDLAFTWDWGDGTPATATTYYNDGAGPDPYPSPGGTSPFTATDAAVHAFAEAGTYTVTLTMGDDDGGASEILITVNLG